MKIINYLSEPQPQVRVLRQRSKIDPYIRVSNNVFDIDDDNDRWLFVAVNTLHELVHRFEPVDIDLQEAGFLFYSFVKSQHIQEAVQRTFERGEIFEIMMFGGMIGRIDKHTLQGRCSESDQDFQFIINHHHQYRHFFHSYDLTIIYNIINRKKDGLSFTISFVQLVGVSLIFSKHFGHKRPARI